MSVIKRNKWPLIAILIIITALMFALAVGFTIGFLSENPDGLERVLTDYFGEEWLENLFSPWIPFLSWLSNDYIAGIVGIVLSVTVLMGVFYLINHHKKRKLK
ncbi:MAG: PDGLE domain-containing protein [Candidatus Lokiarchaeota archaeon]|nr:PDGLE domain-containing protein [Candidatus Lokiarchaeota archaeon]